MVTAIVEQFSKLKMTNLFKSVEILIHVERFYLEKLLRNLKSFDITTEYNMRF